MKMMTKLLCLLLCAALFLEFCPLDALAAGNIASEKELETAWALSGQDPEAAHWHRGMTPQDSWNAEQLDEWLDYVLDEVLYSVQNAHSDMKTNLYKIQSGAPEAYDRLTNGANGLYLQYMQGASRRVEDLRQQLRAYRTDFIMYADRIAGLIDQIRDDSVSEREKIRYSRQLESAVATIRADRAEVVANYEDWLEQIDAWHADFTGDPSADRQARLAELGANAADMRGWVKEVMSWHEAPVRTVVSARLHPDGRNNSVLAKLSVARSALGAQDSDTEVVHVIPDTQFVVNLSTPVELDDPSNPPDPTPTPMPVVNGTVTVWDAKDIKHPDTVNPHTTAVVTEVNGDATFNVSEFTVDDDGFMRVGIFAQTEGYQSVEHYIALVQKGGVYDISLTPDGGEAEAASNAASKPYFFDVSFNNNYVLKQEYMIYYTSENNVISDIVAKVWYPDGYTGSKDVTLKYYDINGKDPETGKNTGAWVTATVKGDAAKPYTQLASLPGEYLVYTFSDQWNMKFKPGETVSCYIGAESDGLAADLMLTVKRGAVDQPIFTDSGTGAMSGITDTFKGLGNLFSIQLPSDVIKPFGDSMFELNIPLLEYLPKISYDIDGTLTVAYGIDPGITRDQNPPTEAPFGPQPSPAPTHWYDDRSWRSKDQRELDNEVKDAQGETAFAKHKAQVGALWDGIKEKGVNLLGNMKISMGAFAMITGQFGDFDEHKTDQARANEDEKIYYNCRSLNGTIGAIATFTVEATAQFSVFGFASVGVSASLALGLTIGGAWYSFDPLHSNFGRIQWSGNSGLNIMVRVMVSVTIGAGVKGLLSAAVTGYGYINIMIAWTKATGATPWVRITMGAGVSATFTIFWLKYTFTFWKLTPEKVLLDTHNNKTAFNMLDVFAAPALAEEEGDDEPEAMTPLEPEYYPALVPEATQVMDDVSMRNTTVRYAELGDETFAFYIAKTEDGHDRLTWRNLVTGQTGNAQAALREIAEAGEDECGVADKIDYAFDVLGESTRESMDLEPLEPTLVATVLCTSAMADETVETEGKTVVTKAPTDSFAYYLILTSDGKGGLENPYIDWAIKVEVETEEDRYWEWISQTRHGFKSLPLELACAEVEMESYELTGIVDRGEYEDTFLGYRLFLHSSAREYIPHSENGEDTGRNINIYARIELPDFYSRDFVSTYLSSDVPLLEGNTIRYQCGSSFPIGLRDTRTTWYALERAGDDGPGMLVHGIDDNVHNPSLYSIRGKDAEDDVVFYRVLHNKRSAYNANTLWAQCEDSVFFLSKTEDENGEHHWLKQAAVTTFDGMSSGAHTQNFTITDYDVEVKAGSFYAQKVYGVTYIYWLATAQKEKETDPDVYRLKAVVYDPSSDSMSNEMVLAEFSMPQAELIPADVFLSENGTGYCTAVVGEGDDLRADVYSFPVNWITSLELNAMTLADTHANPATWLDIVVSLMNSGNTGIGWFELEVYSVEDDGTQTVVETLRCDCLDSDKSAIYEGSTLVSDGDHTIQRLEDVVKPFQRTGHNVTRESWDSHSGYVAPTDQFGDSVMLLPGAVKAYNMPLFIPANWEGYKTLFLRVSKVATRANWLAANAAAGSAEKSNALNAALDLQQNPEIVYARAAGGAMVRTDNANALLAANGDAANAALRLSPLYPEQVKGTEPLALNHDIHDLSVSHRVYRDANGDEYIAITLLNLADTGEPLKLNACIYMDGDSEPVSLALPYYQDKTTDSYTHTITLRMDDLLGGRHPRNALVIIESEGAEETALRNNQFMLHFDDDEVDDPLRIAVQPAPVSAQPGETATFRVKAAGGVRPYAYQWQVWMDEKTGWKDISGGDSARLTVENVTPAMHGRKARCIVTDHYLNSVVSSEAMLTVAGDRPETGDDTNLPLYLAVALLAMALMWWLRRREKKTM